MELITQAEVAQRIDIRTQKRKTRKKARTKSVELNVDGPPIQTIVAEESAAGHPIPRSGTEVDSAVALNLVEKNTDTRVDLHCNAKFTRLPPFPEKK